MASTIFVLRIDEPVEGCARRVHYIVALSLPQPVLWGVGKEEEVGREGGLQLVCMGMRYVGECRSRSGLRFSATERNRETDDMRAGGTVYICDGRGGRGLFVDEIGGRGTLWYGEECG